MASDYLAMYLKVAFDMGELGNVVAIRHFSAATSRLSDAVKSGNLFTDLEDVKIEAQQCAAQKRVTVLLDSTLPGRDKILPQEGKDAVDRILKKLNDLSNPTAPIIGGPAISSISIRSGMRNMSFPRPYRQGFVDNRNFRSSLFSMDTSGGTRFQIIPPVSFNGNMFFAVTFFGWDQMLLTIF
jgi:hypothetical protein